MLRKGKIYSRPKKAFDKERIGEEAKIIKEFGLKNKREIWKAEERIKVIRERAKNLISSSREEQELLFKRLKKQGFNVNSIGEVLSLDKRDYLKRRLQTVIFNKRFASKINSARQLIVHKKVLVDGKIINSPSYVVPIELENKITLKQMKTKKPVKKEEIVEEENGE
ncbi:MAG: 30S ribosomal protein S4 [archaeon]|nr:30S ribosomal protein S4 [archaeon]